MEIELAHRAGRTFAGLVCAKIARHIARERNLLRIVSELCVSEFVRNLLRIVSELCVSVLPGNLLVSLELLAAVFPEFLKKKEAKKKE